MLISKLKECIQEDENIEFKFSYSNNKYEIIIDHHPNDEDDSIVNDSERMYEILKELMPEDLIYDWQDCIIGEDNLECSGYILYKNYQFLFEGETYLNRLIIKETEFNKAIDFYIHLYSKFQSFSISSKEIIAKKVNTPLQIFIEFIETKGYKLNGFKYGGIDDDGYSYTAFDIQINEEKNILVEYPQKDTFSASIFDESNYLKFKDFEHSNILSYNSEFLELLEFINEDNLDSYISDKAWDE